MTTISPEELKLKIAKKEDFQLIDIRESFEFEAFNIGGENIPMDKIFSSLAKIAQNKPVIFCCNSGKKSAAIIHTIKRKLNLINVYSLAGGLENF